MNGDNHQGILSILRPVWAPVGCQQYLIWWPSEYQWAGLFLFRLWKLCFSVCLRQWCGGIQCSWAELIARLKGRSCTSRRSSKSTAHSTSEPGNQRQPPPTVCHRCSNIYIPSLPFYASASICPPRWSRYFCLLNVTLVIFTMDCFTPAEGSERAPRAKA